MSKAPEDEPVEFLGVPYVSRSDPNGYRIIKLKNGIKCILVSLFGCEELESTIVANQPVTDICDESVKNESSIFNRRREPLSVRKEKAKLEKEKVDAKKLQNYQGPNCEESGEEGSPSFLDKAKTLLGLGSAGQSKSSDSENVWHIPEERVIDPELADLASRRRCIRGSQTKISLSVACGSLNDPPGLEGVSKLVADYVAHEIEEQIWFPKRVGRFYVSANVDAESTIFEVEYDTRESGEMLKRFAKAIGNIQTDRDPTSDYLELREPPFREWATMNRERDCWMDPTNDARRAAILFQLAKEDHPIRIFSKKGGLIPQTHVHELDDQLEAMDAQKTEFLLKHYVGNAMTLSVEAEESLDNLEAWVMEYFGDIAEGESDEVRQPLGDLSPFDTDEFRKIYIVKCNQPAWGGAEYLVIAWSLPAEHWQNYFVKPLSYLSAIISDRGPHGLSYYLSQRGLASGVSCACRTQGTHRNRYHSLFEIQVTLQIDGIQKVDEVISIVFSYIKFLRQNGVHKSLYEDLVKLRRSRFNAVGAELTEYSITEMASFSAGLWVMGSLPDWVRMYNPKDSIVASFLIVDYEASVKSAIADVVDLLLPETANYMMCLYSDSDTSQEFLDELTEPLFESKYVIEDINDEQYAAWRNVSVPNEFGFPDPNPFLTTSICRKFSKIKKSKEIFLFDDGKNPKPKYRVWFQPNVGRDYYSWYYFHLVSPIAFSTPENVAMLQVWSLIVDHTLSGVVQQLSWASIYGAAEITDYGFYITLGSWNNKFALAYSLILDAIFQSHEKISEKIFDSTKREFKKRLEYSVNYDPYVVKNLYDSLTVKRKWTIPELNTELNSMTFKDVQEFIVEFKSKCSVAAFMSGNVSREDAQDLSIVIDRHFSSKDLVSLTKCKRKFYQIPRQEDIVRINSSGPLDSVTNFYQIGRSDVKSRLIAQFIVDIIVLRNFYTGSGDGSFPYLPITQAELNSKKKSERRLENESMTEYTNIATEIMDRHGILTLKISENLWGDDNAHVDRRNKRIQDTIELFYKTKLESMTKEEFQKKIQCFEKSCPTFPGYSVGFYNEDIILQNDFRAPDAIRDLSFRFDETCLRHSAREDLTLVEVQNWFKLYLTPGSAEFRKLSVQMVGVCESDKLTIYQSMYNDHNSKEEIEKREKWWNCMSSNWQKGRIDLNKISHYKFLPGDNAEKGKEICDGRFITDSITFTNKLYMFPVAPLRN